MIEFTLLIALPLTAMLPVALFGLFTINFAEFIRDLF
jgi:hypothetical protein